MQDSTRCPPTITEQQCAAGYTYYRVKIGLRTVGSGETTEFSLYKRIDECSEDY